MKRFLDIFYKQSVNLTILTLLLTLLSPLLHASDKKQPDRERAMNAARQLKTYQHRQATEAIKIKEIRVRLSIFMTIWDQELTDGPHQHTSDQIYGIKLQPMRVPIPQAGGQDWKIREIITQVNIYKMP